MKHLITSLLLLFLIGNIPSLSIAQVTEGHYVMSLGTQNALTITLPGTDSKFVLQNWKMYCKELGKVKKVKKSDEWLTNDAYLVDIGGVNPVDIYAKFENISNAVQMTAWFDLGSTFLSSSDNPDQYQAGVDFLEDYAFHLKKEGVRIEVTSQEKQLKVLENDINKLQRLNDNYNKQMKQADEKIRKMKENIEKNEKEQEQTQKKLEAQKKLVDEVRDKFDNLKKD